MAYKIDTKGIPERVEEALHHARLTPRSASLQAGMAHTFVRDILGRGSIPKVDAFFTLAHVMGVDPVWLATGEGAMIPGSNSTGALNCRVRIVPHEQVEGALTGTQIIATVVAEPAE